MLLCFNVLCYLVSCYLCQDITDTHGRLFKIKYTCNEKCTENEVKILKIKADLGLYHPHHLKLSRHELDYVLQISQQHRKPVNLK